MFCPNTEFGSVSVLVRAVFVVNIESNPDLILKLLSLLPERLTLSEVYAPDTDDAFSIDTVAPSLVAVKGTAP